MSFSSGAILAHGCFVAEVSFSLLSGWYRVGYAVRILQHGPPHAGGSDGDQEPPGRVGLGRGRWGCGLTAEGHLVFKVC